MSQKAISQDQHIDEDYKIIREYLEPRSKTFQGLVEIEETVEKCPKADEYYKTQKERAASPTRKLKMNFFKMMTKIGNALQAKEKIIPLPSKTINFKVLDICMAPGGYSATALKYNHHAQICGLSLPENEGGHEVLLPKDTRVTVQFRDITMLSAELGFPNLVSQGLPSVSQFSNDIPYIGQAFDLVFCDGNVLSTHERAVESVNERARLTAAQLVIALQRIKPGGTIVMLLRKAYDPLTVRLLEAFSQFSEIALFKPKVSHAKRSSFYLVAKNMDPKNASARRLVNYLRSSWRRYTARSFGVEFSGDSIEEGQRQDAMEDIMKSFGGRLITLAEPLWKIQKEAMEKKFLTGQT